MFPLFFFKKITGFRIHFMPNGTKDGFQVVIEKRYKDGKYAMLCSFENVELGYTIEFGNNLNVTE